MKSALPAIAIVLILAGSLMLPASAAVYYSASTPQIITKGDAFTISGTGAENGTVALWIIGRKYFEVRTTAPDRHGNFSLFIKPTETEKFFTGRYAFVLQDPGPSGILEIEAGKDSTGNITVMKRGKIVTRLGAKEELQGNVEHEADTLISTASLQGVDDTFLLRYFFIEDPAVRFDTIIPASGSRLPDFISGHAIRITGTTNIGTDNPLVAELRHTGTDVPILTKELPVMYGIGLNSWSYQLNEPGLEAGNYEISVGWTKANRTGNGLAWFSVKPEEPRHVLPEIVPTEIPDVPLPKGLDTLLLLGIIFVFAVVLYTVGKK